MKVSIDAADFTKEIAFAQTLPKNLKTRIWKRVRVVSFQAERFIKLRMPVRTGRARASWGHSSAPAGPGEGIWEEAPDALAITQGSRVEYIENLNQGSSSQAPAGFIDAETRRAEQALEDGLQQDIEDAFK